jgi:hypothetical protein
MRVRALIVVCVLVATAAATATATATASAAATAEASGTAVSQIRSVYRTVLNAEYFGPASGECSHLTAAAVKSFTAGGPATCTKAFDEQEHVLRHKTRGVDDSGYTANQWRQVVSSVMAHLKVSVHGARASAIGGQSGIPGKTTLVEISGTWLFNSYPPSIQP